MVHRTKAVPTAWPARSPLQLRQFRSPGPRNLRWETSGRSCRAVPGARHSRAMIVLFTDFGLAGPYTGQVEAVLHQTAPGVPVVSLFADAPAGQPKTAAYLLAAYAAWFPAGTVLLCVVDPGVGGARRALIIEAEAAAMSGRTTVCSNWCCGAPRHRDVGRSPGGRRAVGELPRTRPVCAGRGAAGPRRAGDRAGAPVDAGPPCGMARRSARDRLCRPLRQRADRVARRRACRKRAARSPAGEPIGHAATFSAVPPGEAFWYVNSNGLVEIAVNGGRADRALGLADRQRGLAAEVSQASGRRQHRFGSRRQPQLTPPLQPMQQPDAAANRHEHQQHDDAEGASDIAEDGAESMAEEIAGRDEARRPQAGGGEIEPRKRSQRTALRPSAKDEKLRTP